MAKDSQYFSHDFNARNDPKLQEVLMHLGCEGIGVYWCLVELLHEQGGHLRIQDIGGTAYALHVDEQVVDRVVREFGLFEVQEEMQTFTSKSVLNRMERRKEVSEARREAGRRGGLARSANFRSSNSQAIGTESEAIAWLLNKNKLNKNNSSFFKDNTSEKEECLICFYFDRVLSNPVRELERFWNYYEAGGWQWRDGKPIVDRLAVARNWKPENGHQRVKGAEQMMALRWLKAAYEAAREADDRRRQAIIVTVSGMTSREEDGKLTLIYRCSREAADCIKAHIGGVEDIVLKWQDVNG